MDTMAPGYMYVEYFVQEEDTSAPQNQPNPNNTANAKPTVTVNRGTDSKVKTTSRNIRMMLGGLISKFIRWCADNLAKVSTKFAEKHRLEYTWVKNNEELNSQIAQSLDSKNLNITVNNFPRYKVDMQRLTNVQNYGDKIERALNNGNVDKAALFKELLPDGLKDKITFEGIVW